MQSAIEDFARYELEDLQPYGIMPEGLPRVLPPFREHKQFKIADQFTYISNTGLVVQSIEDTLTDLASVPRYLKPLLRVPGRESAGAVVHDEGYRNPLRPRFNIITGKWELLSMRDWNRIFDDINTLAEVIWVKRQALNSGLALGGWACWRRSLKRNPSTLPCALLSIKEYRDE